MQFTILKIHAEVGMIKNHFKLKLSQVMRLWYFSSSFFSNSHPQPSSGARRPICDWTLRLLPYFMCANSEGSGETVQMPEPSLVAYVISTISHELAHYLNFILKYIKSPGNQQTVLELKAINELTLLESTPVSVCNFLAFSTKALVGISPSCCQKRNVSHVWSEPLLFTDWIV